MQDSVQLVDIDPLPDTFIEIISGMGDFIKKLPVHILSILGIVYQRQFHIVEEIAHLSDVIVIQI